MGSGLVQFILFLLAIRNAAKTKRILCIQKINRFILFVAEVTSQAGQIDTLKAALRLCESGKIRYPKEKQKRNGPGKPFKLDWRNRKETLEPDLGNRVRFPVTITLQSHLPGVGRVPSRSRSILKSQSLRTSEGPDFVALWPPCGIGATKSRKRTDIQ